LTDRKLFGSLVDVGEGIPSVVWMLSSAPAPLVKSVIAMSSMLIRLVPPSSLRISNRMVPARLTVNVAVANEPPVVIRDVPTWAHVAPWSCDENRPHVPLASEPKLAWWRVTVPAPEVRSNPIVMWPLLRIRPDFVPVSTSELLVPISASLRFQVPEPSVTSAAA
jgi:hypothetical protein